MKVRDIMTSPVVSIEPESAVLEAVRIMLERHQWFARGQQGRRPRRNRNGR
jgi:CBS domain-containing protein